MGTDIDKATFKIVSALEFLILNVICVRFWTPVFSTGLPISRTKGCFLGYVTLIGSSHFLSTSARVARKCLGREREKNKSSPPPHPKLSGALCKKEISTTQIIGFASLILFPYLYKMEADLQPRRDTLTLPSGKRGTNSFFIVHLSKLYVWSRHDTLHFLRNFGIAIERYKL